jgi:pyruvate formate lyase activating enzyme
MLENLIEKNLVDYIAMDIKAPSEKYSEVIGFKNSSLLFLLGKIEQSINILKESSIEYEFRTTLVPGLLDRQDILKIAHWISPCKKYVLQNFRPQKTLDPNFENLQPYPSKYLFEIQKAITPFFEICEVRE